jgi:hypothetical protein
VRPPPAKGEACSPLYALTAQFQLCSLQYTLQYVCLSRVNVMMHTPLFKWPVTFFQVQHDKTCSLHNGVCQSSRTICMHVVAQAARFALQYTWPRPGFVLCLYTLN